MGKENSINITVRWLAGKEAKQPGETWDSNLPGFGVRRGKKKRTFFMMTRVAGRQRRFTVGDVALMDLADAREKALAIKDGAAKGIDPAAAEKAATREAERTRARTFRAVAKEYMGERAGLRSHDELQRKLDVDILPVIGDMAVSEIDRADVRELLRDKAKDSPVASNRLLSLIRSILRFAFKNDYVPVNVADAIDALPESSRDRVLTHDEIALFWAALDGNMSLSTRTCLKFLLVTGQRRGETAGAKWPEFSYSKGLWSIPASRTKNGLAHAIPMSDLAWDVLADIAEGGEYVFPGAMGDAPLSPYSVSQGMKKALPKMNLPGGRATPHDLRRTVVTEMNETLRIEPHVVEAAVNHVSGAARAGVAGVYNKALYLEQRTLALEAWGNLLREIVAGEVAPSNLLYLPGR